MPPSRRKRLLYRALDAIYTARTRPAKPGWVLLADACRCSSVYDRVGILGRLATVSTPSLMLHVQRSLDRSDSLPVRAARAAPFAFGRGSTCALLDGDPPRIVKVFRESLGQDVPTLVALARILRADFEMLRRWYGFTPSLLPHTIHVVLHAPLLGVAAAARIQDLVTGATSDLLCEGTRKELIDLLRRSPMLREQVEELARATRGAWEREGQCLDLMGPGNVLMVGPASAPELRIVDFGIFDMAHLLRTAPQKYERMARTLEFLERAVTTSRT